MTYTEIQRRIKDASPIDPVKSERAMAIFNQEMRQARYENWKRIRMMEKVPVM